MRRTFYASRGLGAEPAPEKGVLETVAPKNRVVRISPEMLEDNKRYSVGKLSAERMAKLKTERRMRFLQNMSQGRGKVTPFRVPPGISRQKTKKIGQYRISKVDAGSGPKWVVERDISADLAARREAQRQKAEENSLRREEVLRRMKEDPQYAEEYRRQHGWTPAPWAGMQDMSMDDMREAIEKAFPSNKKSGVNGLAGLFGLGSQEVWEVVAIAENESQAATLAESAQDNVETLAPGEQATPSTDMATPGGGAQSPTEAVDEQPKVLGMKRNTALLVGGGLLAAFLMTRG